MIFLALEVQSTKHTDICHSLNAWINVDSQPEAMGILHEELSLEGWALIRLLDSSTTVESDYFAPCKSLDAFKEAQTKQFAYRLNNES